MSMPRPGNAKAPALNRAGFTLLELLISFMLIGVVVAIMANALRLGFQTVERGEKKVDRLERFRSSFSIVDAQVQSLLPLVADADGERRLFFFGGREEVEFATNYSIWGGEKGYVVVRYAVTADEEGRRYVSATEHVVGMETSREARLFNPMEDIFFEYFYKGPADEKGDWVDEWTDETATPEKIRLHLVEGNRDIAWIIPVRTAGSIAQPGAAAPTTPGGLFRQNGRR